MPFDSILMLAFGGPEKPEDIRPFLAHVTRGRPIPPARIEEVAHHYERIGGTSPINVYTARQARGLERALRAEGYAVPVYVGMRNWHPFLEETIRRMHADGRRRVVGVIMAAHQSDASWDVYRRSVAEAIAAADVSFDIVYAAPVYDHPCFIEAVAERVARCLARIPDADRPATPLVFTAHSIPSDMAAGAPYEQQLRASSRLVAEQLRHPLWHLAYQSRSGRPSDPWLGPDICEVLRELASRNTRHVIVVPIGFLCDHVEVLYDLDIAAGAVAREVGLVMHRAEGVNDAPHFIEALADRVKAVIRAG